MTDRDLTPAKMMEFAGVMNDVDPNSIVTYQIEATGRNINGASVLIPTIDGDNMQAVLSLFTGQTSLADMPEQVLADTTTAAPRGATTTIANATAASDESTPSGSTRWAQPKARARRRRPSWDGARGDVGRRLGDRHLAAAGHAAAGPLRDHPAPRRHLLTGHRGNMRPAVFSERQRASCGRADRRPER